MTKVGVPNFNQNGLSGWGAQSSDQLYMDWPGSWRLHGRCHHQRHLQVTHVYRILHCIGGYFQISHVEYFIAGHLQVSHVEYAIAIYLQAVHLQILAEVGLPCHLPSPLWRFWNPCASHPCFGILVLLILVPLSGFGILVPLISSFPLLLPALLGAGFFIGSYNTANNSLVVYMLGPDK